jgi:hypothetical protein
MISRKAVKIAKREPPPDDATLALELPVGPLFRRAVAEKA